MKIGLISDTHGHLDPKVFKYFEQCDEIWHAGDIGTEEILDELEKFKPTRAVFGNIDGDKIRIRTKEDFVGKVGDEKVLITHIAGKPPKYNPRVRKLIAEHRPTILICGHSHFLKVERDKVNNLLFMNPGAAGKHGFHKIKTLLRFDLSKGQIADLEVIELGPRAKID